MDEKKLKEIVKEAVTEVLIEGLTLFAGEMMGRAGAAKAVPTPSKPSKETSPTSSSAEPEKAPDFVALRQQTALLVSNLAKTKRSEIVAALQAVKAAKVQEVKDENLADLLAALLKIKGE